MPNNKIKIVYFIDTLSVGGAERFLYNLCRYLDKTKFEIYVCAVVSGGSLESDFNQLGINLKIFSKKTKLGWSLFWQLYKFLQQVKPDIVHSHLFGGDTVGRLAALVARVPVILSTEHNINIDENRIKKTVKLILSWFTGQIIAISQSVKAYSVSQEGIKADKITIISYGVDFDKFKFREYQPISLGQEIKAVTVGRLVKQKGQEYLLSALPLILQKYPGFKLNIIGSGPLEKDLKNQAAKLGVAGQVKFWGEQADIAQILPSMDLFILPSLWEGLGLVILEAQAVGVPVLASDVPAIAENVKPDQTGLLFETKNPEAIFKQVDNLLQNPDLAEKIVQQAHEQVSQYSWQFMTEKYSQLYYKLLTDK